MLFCQFILSLIRSLEARTARTRSDSLRHGHSSASYWCLPHVVPPVMIGLNLDIENALGDGPVAVRHSSTLDVKIESKVIVLGQDQRKGHHYSICHPDHRLT
eukprot:2021403-Pleurochrysis_carterae.AAC.1